MHLLLAEFHHLGDAVLSLPFLRTASTKTQVFVVCRPCQKEIYEMALPAERIFVWEPWWMGARPVDSLRALWDLLPRLRRLKFQIGVSVHPDPRIAFLFACAGIEQRIGYAPAAINWYAVEQPWRRRSLTLASAAHHLLQSIGCSWTQSLLKATASQHHLESWSQLASTLGWKVDETTPWFTPPPACPSGFSSNSEHVDKGARPYRVALHAGSRLPSKQWPLARWRELAENCLARPDWEVLEIVPPDQAGLQLSHLPVVRPATVSALANLLATADLLVAHDSLPAHLAAALGRPVRAIFGSGSPSWFSPGGQDQTAVSDSSCPDKPCFDRCTQACYLCLDRISVNQVWLSILSAFPGSGDPPTPGPPPSPNTKTSSKNSSLQTNQSNLPNLDWLLRRLWDRPPRRTGDWMQELRDGE